MQKNGRNAHQGKDGFGTPGPCGFAKAGGKNVPTSSGSPQRTIYTSGRPQTLAKPIYGATPKQALDPRPNVRPAGARSAHRIGQRG